MWHSCLQQNVNQIRILILLILWHGTLAAGPAKHETVTLELHTSQTLKSPKYPRCCSSGEHTYLLQVGEKSSPGDGFIRLIFHDLDLPPGSKLQLYDGGNSTSALFDAQPEFSGGGAGVGAAGEGRWTRPVIASTGPQLYLTFLPGPRDYKRHIGFKITFWTVAKGPETWTVDKPFTDCPEIGDPVDGGDLRLTTVRADPTFYHFSCIWQLKLPENTDYTTSLSVYVRLTNINIDEYGRVEILDDAFSEARELDLYRDTRATTTDDFLLWGQPLGGYTSPRGLYIMVKKPLDRGHVQFVYGVFATADKSKDECHFTLHGATFRGFKCRRPDTWCIPREHQCNGLVNCADGSDEDPRLCDDAPRVGASLPEPDSDMGGADGAEGSTPVPGEQPFCNDNECPFCQFLGQKTCPDLRCYPANQNCPSVCDKKQEKCSDGTCISKYYGSCPGHCGSHEKTCRDNSCVSKFHRCPEDACPTYKPYKCKTGRCYYECERCNNYPDCFDGFDETGCMDGDAYLNWVFISLFLLVPLLCFALVCYSQSAWCKSRRDQGFDQCAVQNGGLRLVSMQGASAGITATADYGSQTFTQDDTSHLVTTSTKITVALPPPVNRHLTAVMNGHVSRGGVVVDPGGTDTPPPPCSTPPPTYEQAVLGGASRRNENRLASVSEAGEVDSRRSSGQAISINIMNVSNSNLSSEQNFHPTLQSQNSDSTSPKQGLSSAAGTMSNVSTVGVVPDDQLNPEAIMPLSTSTGGLGTIAGIAPIESLGGGLDSEIPAIPGVDAPVPESTVDQDIIQAFEANRRRRRGRHRSKLRDYLLGGAYHDDTTTSEETSSDSDPAELY